MFKYGDGYTKLKVCYQALKRKVNFDSLMLINDLQEINRRKVEELAIYSVHCAGELAIHSVHCTGELAIHSVHCTGRESIAISSLNLF